MPAVEREGRHRRVDASTERLPLCGVGVPAREEARRRAAAIAARAERLRPRRGAVDADRPQREAAADEERRAVDGQSAHGAVASGIRNEVVVAARAAVAAIDGATIDAAQDGTARGRRRAASHALHPRAPERPVQRAPAVGDMPSAD